MIVRPQKKPAEWRAIDDDNSCSQSSIDIIRYSNVMVKYLERKYSLKNLFLYAYLQKITNASDFDRLVEIWPNHFIPLPPDDRPVHEECDADIPNNLKLTKHPMKRGKTVNKSDRFKSAYENADAEFFPDEILVQSFKTQMETAPMLAIYNDIYKGIKYRAPVKGSPAYNHQKANILKFVAETFSSMYKYVYFVTNTYSPKHHGYDRVFAWQYMREEMNRIQKALVRKYKCKYITIFESTKNQYPHAHSILFSDRPLTGETSPTKKPVKIKYGELFNRIKQLVTSPVFDLRRAVNKNLAGYILKYVAKTFSKQEQPTLDGDISLSDSEKKALGSMIWPCIAGVRQFSYSKLPKSAKPVEVKAPKVPTLEEKWVKDVEKENLKLPLRDQIEIAARRAAALIDFRIKSHQICKRRVILLSSKHLTPTERELSGKTFAPRRSVFREKTVFARKMGCPGCLLETAYELYWQNPEDFQKNFPENPWFEPSQVITDPISDIHEKTARIDWDIRFTKTPLGERRITAGYTKEKQREDRWEFADFLKQHRREVRGLALGELFLGEGNAPKLGEA